MTLEVPSHGTHTSVLYRERVDQPGRWKNAEERDKIRRMVRTVRRPREERTR